MNESTNIDSKFKEESIPVDDIHTYPILYIDDEDYNLQNFQLSFDEEFTILTANSAEEGLKILEQNDNIGLIITDERMPGMSGIEFLETVVEKWPETVRIIISAYSDAEVLLKAINTGKAHEYIVKPWDKNDLRSKLEAALNMVKNRRELKSSAVLNDIYKEEIRQINNPDEIIGKTSGLKKVIDIVNKIARTDVPTLIYGETGTGKEIVARLLHESSLRSNGPFVKINCAAISEGVLESELFGHEKGAFTGAIKTRKGKFEIAHRGTLLLDEIGDISPKLQLSLLRILQEKEFERVGGNKTIRTDSRIIAATNKSLEAMVEQGRFREDLYFRLNVIPINIAPLRERKQDIRLFVEYFVEKYSKKYLLGRITIEENVILQLQKYHFPGNVRELQNLVQRALVMSKDNIIRLDDLTFDIKAISQVTDDSVSERDQFKIEKKDELKKILEDSNWNLNKAAKKIGIPRSTLRSRAVRMGLI